MFRLPSSILKLSAMRRVKRHVEYNSDFKNDLSEFFSTRFRGASVVRLNEKIAETIFVYFSRRDTAQLSNCDFHG